jgi:hypothetical protein
MVQDVVHGSDLAKVDIVAKTSRNTTIRNRTDPVLYHNYRAVFFDVPPSELDGTGLVNFWITNNDKSSPSKYLLVTLP